MTAGAVGVGSTPEVVGAPPPVEVVASVLSQGAHGGIHAQEVFQREVMDVSDPVARVVFTDEPPPLAVRGDARLGREGGARGGWHLGHQRGGARGRCSRDADAVPRFGADALACWADAGVPGDEFGL